MYAIVNGAPTNVNGELKLLPVWFIKVWVLILNVHPGAEEDNVVIFAKENILKQMKDQKRTDADMVVAVREVEKSENKVFIFSKGSLFYI